LKAHKLPALAVALAVALSPLSAQAKGRPSPEAYTVRLRQILIQMQNEALADVSAVMSDVCSWLEDYGRQDGHFPATDVEAAAARASLQRLMPANPFNLAVAQRPPETRHIPTNAEERIKVNFVVDMGLDRDAVKALIDLPPDTWQAPAGTITVISNGYHLAAIWASGADQRPIKDATGKAHILVASCRR